MVKEETKRFSTAQKSIYMKAREGPEGNRGGDMNKENFVMLQVRDKAHGLRALELRNKTSSLRLDRLLSTD